MSYPTDKEAIDYLQPAIETMNAYYKERGILHMDGPMTATQAAQPGWISQ